MSKKDINELNNEWLESFKSHQDWFKSLKERGHKKEVSKTMRSVYNSTLRQLVRFFRFKIDGDKEANPDSVLKWAKSVKPKMVVRMLYNFENWLQGKDVEGYKKRIPKRKDKFLNPLSATQRAHGTARGFFTHNEMWLPRSGKKTTGRSKVKKNDVNYAVFKVDPNNPSMVIADYSQFRFFLSHLTPRDQTIALCMLSTSQDSADVLNLKVGFFTKQEGRDRLFWENIREKTGEEFRTFFSKEATKFLRQYIAEERDGADPDEPLFVRGKWERNGKEEDVPYEVKSVIPRNISHNFLAVAKKMHLTNGEDQNPFRPKRLRSIFSSACYQAKIDDGVRHIFQGHTGTVSEKYREMPSANLELIYAKVEPYVTVFAEDRTQELVETRKKSERALDLALDLREENKKLREDIEILRRWLDAFNNTISMLIEAIEEKELQEEMKASLSEVPKLSYLDVVREQNKGKK